MWNSKETFPKCIFQFTSMPQFTFSPTTFIPKAYFYKNKPKGLKVTKEDPRLIGSMRGFCDKYIHIFFSISTSFSLYPHLFEYIHIPHYYIHIFSSISTSVVAILESLSRLKNLTLSELINKDVIWNKIYVHFWICSPLMKGSIIKLRKAKPNYF